MARRHPRSPGFGFGPVSAVQAEETRGQSFHSDRPPAFLQKEAGQRLTEVSGIKCLRRLDTIAVDNRSDESVVSAGPGRESDFPKQTGGLRGYFTFEDDPQLVEGGAADRERRVRSGGDQGSKLGFPADAAQEFGLLDNLDAEGPGPVEFATGLGARHDGVGLLGDSAAHPAARGLD